MLAIAFLSCLYIVRAHGLSLQLPFSFGGRAPIFNPDVATTLNFELRHVHGLNIERGRSVFRDVPASSSLSFSTLASGSPRRKMRLQSKRIKVHRPRSQHQFHAARQQLRLRPKQNYAQSWRVDWNEDEIDGPDVRDRETLLLLAKMTNDAYLSPGESGWYDLGENWNAVCIISILSDVSWHTIDFRHHRSQSYPFGWEPDADGFRGHIFATPDNSTVVLSIKGTSPKVLGGGPTSKKDKLNDNLLWSCCCARVDWSWTPVCGCYSGSNKCDQDCLEESLQDESLFYSIGTVRTPEIDLETDR
jgi:putative lipase involved disintegration of autophagic bodies